MRNVCIYIAASLDGYIAGPGDDLGFLSMVDAPPEDYGYQAFIDSVDTIIMGRRTYDTVLGFGIPFPHKGKNCYVLSSTRTGSDENVTYYNGAVANLLAELRRQPGANIYIDGGAQVMGAFLAADLVDSITLSVIPTLLGGGARLFDSGFPQCNLRLTGSQAYPTGLVQLRYERLREQSIVC